MAQRSRSSKCARLSPPAPPKGPMFQIFLNQAYLECPNLCISPQPVFGRIGHNGSEIQVLQVCSTIRPRPPKWPHVSDFFEPSIFGMPQPMPFTKTCFWSNWSQWLRDAGPQSVLDYPPPAPPKGPMSLIFLNQAYLECPNLCLSPKPVFGRIGHNGSEIQVLKVCSTIAPRPTKRPHVSDFFEPSIFGMPQPMHFTTTCFWSNWSQWLRDPSPPSVLDYPPHKKAPMFQFF